MITTDGVREYARLSLFSVMLTAVAITVNHTYTLGASAFALGGVLLVAPAVLMMWWRTRGSRVAFIGYILMNLWIVVGFGLMKVSGTAR